MTLLLSLGWITILGATGWITSGFMLPPHAHSFRTFAAVPLGAIVNVLLIALLTMIHLPLQFLTLFLGHALLIAGGWMVLRRRTIAWSLPQQKHPKHPRIWLRALCIALLGNVVLFGLVHAVLLHSFAIDSLTNWAMRSQISWSDGDIAFDPTESRGMAKPQYPFLIHGVQILVNAGNAAWSDRAANTATLILSLSAFGLLFTLLKHLRSTDTALLTLTVIASTPLLALHLAQGYGDIHLVEYVLLAALCVAMHAETCDDRWLLPSAAFVLGALWTKSEGLTFALMPWSALMLWRAFRTHTSWRRACALIAVTVLLFLPFLALIFARGLSLTPHQSDTSVAFHPEALPALWASLFALGSSGIAWYVLPPALLLAASLLLRRSLHTDPRSVPLLLWGTWIALETVFIYTCTPNVVFLKNGESFFRQMLPAIALLQVGLVLLLRPSPTQEP